jgi:hypothetical protein
MVKMRIAGRLPVSVDTSGARPGLSGAARVRPQSKRHQLFPMNVPVSSFSSFLFYRRPPLFYLGIDPYSYNFAADLNTPYKNIKAGDYDRIKTTNDNYWYGEYAPTANVKYDDNATGQGVNGRNGVVSSGDVAPWEGSGGGYYGGNAITANDKGDSGGGGGSNYIGGGFSSTTNETAASYGNGAFKIKYIGDGQ